VISTTSLPKPGDAVNESWKRTSEDTEESRLASIHEGNALTTSPASGEDYIALFGRRWWRMRLAHASTAAASLLTPRQIM
jgi:hypothetical protein